ncbi:hypothetical protein SDC9_119497 [bioreactor metagenome]|uniref:Uncharacterized protein n=1 Tax=bioreactor metagenome TaxID=1076179 RepID=A0A645C6A1_9ZZZZ
MLEIGVGTLLAAYTKNHIIRTYGFNQFLPLFYSESERFFQVNVFFCFTGINSDKSVPMVGSCNYNGINVFAG